MSKDWTLKLVSKEGTYITANLVGLSLLDKLKIIWSVALGGQATVTKLNLQSNPSPPQKGQK